MHYPNEVYSLFAFLGFLCCCIPFPWHLEAWNTGTCFYMAWTGLACLNQFINSIVWNGNVINWAPVWCDISARIIIGSAIAIPAASLCINRRLYHIATVRSATITRAEKRRAVMVDVAIALGIPVLQMILQYIPQGHRFDIWEDIGCFPFTYNTPVAVGLVYAPPVIVGLISAVYSLLSIRAFNKSRMQFKELLSGNNNLKTGRYIRLMCLAGIETLCTVPLGIYSLYRNCSVNLLQPWLGWENTHVDFSRVDQFPSVEWVNTPVATSLDLDRWLIVACAFVFFGFFGFAEEARKNYRSAVGSVVKHVGISSGTFGSGIFTFTGSKGSTTEFSTNGAGTLPVFVKRDVLRKHDSLDSLSDMSASFTDAGGVLNEKDEKAQEPIALEMGYEGLVLPDAGGALADYKVEPYSPAPSSGPSSASSVYSLPDTARPPPAFTRPDSTVIEISSVRYSPTGENYPSPPSRVLDISTAPRRHSFDGPLDV